MRANHSSTSNKPLVMNMHAVPPDTCAPCVPASHRPEPRNDMQVLLSNHDTMVEMGQNGPGQRNKRGSTDTVRVDKSAKCLRRHMLMRAKSLRKDQLCD